MLFELDRIQFGCDSIRLRFDSAGIRLRRANSGFDSVAIRFDWDSIRFMQLETCIPIVIGFGIAFGIASPDPIRL